MLVSDLILRVRDLSGFQSKISVNASGGSTVNDNKIIEAINNAQKQLAKDQFRGFIQTISLSPHRLLASDKYLFLNNYGWSSQVSSTTQAKDFIIIPTREMETRPSYFYEDGSYANPSFAFQNDLVTRYPNEFSSWNGPLVKIETHTITPYLNLHFKTLTLNTFKVSFNVFINNEYKNASYKFDISLSESPYVFRKVNSDLSIIVDYKNMKVSYLHSGSTANNYTIEYLSYPYGRAGACLLYNGNVRRLNAGYEGIQSRDMQVYALPYSVVDGTQSISEIISGDSDILEYFIYECAYQLQLLLRDVDEGLSSIRKEKRDQFIYVNDMKTFNDHAFYPNLP